MLSDRIKKFGVRANTPDRSDEKQNTEVLSTSPDTENTEDTTDAAKAAMSAAFEKAAASASGPTVTTYVDQKLSEVDKKLSEKPKAPEIDPEPAPGAESDGDDKESGDVPLLLRYSATLQSLREAAKAEAAEKNEKQHVSEASDEESEKKETTDALSEEAKIIAMMSPEFSDGQEKEETDASAVEKKEDGPERTVRTYSFDSFTAPQSRTESAEVSEPDTDNVAAKKPRNVILSKSCLYAPILVAVIEGLLLIVSKVSLSSLQNRDGLYLSMVVIQLMIYLIPGIFYCKLRHGSDISSLRLKGTSPDKLYLAVLSAFLMLFAMSAFKIIYLQLDIYESRFAIYAPYLNISSFSSVAEILYMSVTFVLIPAISEEFIFRSVVFGEYSSDGFGYICAAVMSSLLYAMLHFSLVRLPMYFVIGLILAITSIITDSVIISMITAAIFGLLDIFTESYIRSLMRSDYKVLLVFVVITLFLLFLTLFLAETERLFYGKGTSGDPTPKKRVRKEKPPVLLGAAISSPSFIVCAAIFVVGIIVSRL